MSSAFEISLPLALILQLAAANPQAVSDAEAPRHKRIEVSSFALTDARKLDVLSRHGAEAGEGRLSGRIFRTRSGLVYVPVESERSAIEARLRDALLIERLVRRAASRNAQWLAGELERPATARELFLAHVAPRAEALTLIRAHERDGSRLASEIAPEAALDYPDLFFAGTRPRSVADVSRLIEAALARADAAPVASRMPSCGTAGWCTIVTEPRPDTHAGLRR